MVESQRVDGFGDVQARSAGRWKRVCAKEEVLVYWQAALHASGGGSQQLTYLDVGGAY